MILRIGLDFDNTIVDYDRLFAKVALEKRLIPDDLPATKSQVRDYLRQQDREAEWTRLQGYIYGERMMEADLFPGVADFFIACRNWRVSLMIISHKTKHPYLGPRYDLHQAALNWMIAKGFFDIARMGLPREHVFLELSKEAKLRRIATSDCSLFMDDLPEFLLEPSFPVNTARFLFDPKNIYPEDSRYTKVRSWQEYATLIDNIRDH